MSETWRDWWDSGWRIGLYVAIVVVAFISGFEIAEHYRPCPQPVVYDENWDRAFAFGYRCALYDASQVLGFDSINGPRVSPDSSYMQIEKNHADTK